MIGMIWKIRRVGWTSKGQSISIIQILPIILIVRNAAIPLH